MGNNEIMEQDKQFTEEIVEEATKGDEGYSLHLMGGWGFFCPLNDAVVPEKGMVVRLYGRGFGYPVRGLTVDGKVVFYRTEAEDEVYRNNELYGEDAAEWLYRQGPAALSQPAVKDRLIQIRKS